MQGRKTYLSKKNKNYHISKKLLRNINQFASHQFLFIISKPIQTYKTTTILIFLQKKNYHININRISILNNIHLNFEIYIYIYIYIELISIKKIERKGFNLMYTANYSLFLSADDKKQINIINVFSNNVKQYFKLLEKNNNLIKYGSLKDGLGVDFYHF